ncbi:hypothetical protein ACFXG4_23390 [Nocardia sp. NPDC059246]|uniref:hypothetical protein n=1 Tax=unclassified Nocardia TaxID=2637762 RepID=UPI0036939D66
MTLNRLTAIGLIWELNEGKNILVVGRSREDTRRMFDTVTKTAFDQKVSDLVHRFNRSNDGGVIEHVSGHWMTFVPADPGALRGYAPDVIYLNAAYTEDIAAVKASKGAEVICS